MCCRIYNPRWVHGLFWKQHFNQPVKEELWHDIDYIGHKIIFSTSHETFLKWISPIRNLHDYIQWGGLHVVIPSFTSIFKCAYLIAIINKIGETWSGGRSSLRVSRPVDRGAFAQRWGSLNTRLLWTPDRCGHETAELKTALACSRCSLL